MNIHRKISFTLAWQFIGKNTQDFGSHFFLIFCKSTRQFSNFLKRLSIRQEIFAWLDSNLIFKSAYIFMLNFRWIFQPYSFYVSYYLKSRFSVAWLTDKRKVCRARTQCLNLSFECLKLYLHIFSTKIQPMISLLRNSEN